MAGRADAIMAYPATADKVFPNVHVGATNGRVVRGLGVLASLDADATWELHFPLPPSDPSGTMKLVIESYADVAATQSAYLRVLWVAVATAENFDTATLNDEHGGGDLEIEHTTADDDEPIITKVALDADTVSYGTDAYILAHIDLKTASWDLAVTWTFRAYVIWE